MQTIQSIRLYYTEGNSDKEYHAEIVANDGGNIVNFRYGRRGGTLTAGTKTSAPVDFAQAKNIYDQLVKSKTAKGYTPAVSGTAYQGTEQAGIKTDFVPQLLNPITSDEATRLVSDPHWAMQEKMDGERRAAHAENGNVIGMNRKGLIVPLPQAIANELQAISAQQGAIRVDGEIIGDVLYVFDLHIHQGVRIDSMPWLKRMKLAQIALVGCEQIKAVDVAVTPVEKQKCWTHIFTAHGEGLVFKRVDSPVVAGRPNSGGDWLKFKFIESAACCVLEVNSGKRSVKLGLLDSDDDDLKTVAVGNVMIPPNHVVPAVGEIVEVAYLYAYKGGSLYQPVYRGKRTDLDMTACTLNQLKYKPSAPE